VEINYFNSKLCAIRDYSLALASLYDLKDVNSALFEWFENEFCRKMRAETIETIVTNAIRNKLLIKGM
jgi:hypothetical protein